MVTILQASYCMANVRQALMRSPVDQNCACAASSLIAAFLRALQAEVIAKSVEQRYAWLNRQFSLDAINL